MSVFYYQRWTLDELQSVADGSQSLTDILTLNLIKDSDADNAIFTGGAIAAGNKIVALAKKYLFVNPELAAMKIIDFLMKRVFYIYIGKSIVLKFSEWTKEYIEEIIKNLKENSEQGLLLIIKFTMPNEWSEIVEMVHIEIQPYNNTYVERY